MQKIERLYQQIVDTCLVIDKDNYQDLAHDTILKLMDNPYILKEIDSKFMGWVFIVAKNLFIDRKRKQRPTVEYCEGLQHEEVNNQQTEPIEYIRKIENSSLTEIEKLWIEVYLDEVGKFSHIAERLGVTRQTVSKNVKQALNKLR